MEILKLYQVYRGAYEYSVEGREKDYYPQTENELWILKYLIM